LFLGFIEAGVPLGVTFTFLVASPMINEVALILLLGIFGWKVALIYILSGLIIAVVSGLTISAIHPDRLIENIAGPGPASTMFMPVEFNWKERIVYARG
jgi:uncharacterized membrane protein YraQ (UPF0718 family)